MDTATTEIYTLSLHDALPIYPGMGFLFYQSAQNQDYPVLLGFVVVVAVGTDEPEQHRVVRSEEHTSELQSRRDLVCRLLLEKKKQKQRPILSSHHMSDRHSQI